MKKKLFILSLVLLISLPLFANGKAESKDEENVVTTVCRASYATADWYNQMNLDFEKETGIHVDVSPTPGNDDDHVMKVNLDLLAGGDIDVIQSLGPKTYQNRVRAGYFVPLNELVKDAGVDAEQIWGTNIPYETDGNYYSVPLKKEVFCVLYNKDLFDGANVPYPSGSWTWDDYLAIAQKITDADKGIYGSFILADNPFQFIQAKQQGAALYTEDGMCNFNNPQVREAVQFYYDLGNKYKVQPSVSEMQAENVSWNYYAMEGDHLAMFPQGNWFTRLLNSQSDYPRDWKYGVAPLPSAGENGNNNLISMAYSSINKNAKHKDAALKYVLWVGQNQWKYEGGIPALASLSEEDKAEVFGPVAEASNGQVTIDDLYNSFIANGMGNQNSDILGDVSSEYNAIVNEELHKYFMDLETLDNTLENIETRVNEVIENVK